MKQLFYIHEGKVYQCIYELNCNECEKETPAPHYNGFPGAVWCGAHYCQSCAPDKYFEYKKHHSEWDGIVFERGKWRAVRNTSGVPLQGKTAIPFTSFPGIAGAENKDRDWRENKETNVVFDRSGSVEPRKGFVTQNLEFPKGIEHIPHLKGCPQFEWPAGKFCSCDFAWRILNPKKGWRAQHCLNISNPKTEKIALEDFATPFNPKHDCDFE